jgi:hypothetical protein
MDFVQQNVTEISLVAFSFLGDRFTKGTHMLAVERLGDPSPYPVIVRISNRHTDPGNRLQCR